MRRAVTVGDLAYARLPGFERRVRAALEVIRQAAGHGRIMVSYSGGKDSTVLLDLVRQVQQDCAAVFFDSGAEYPWTYDLVEHYRVERVAPEKDLPTLCRDYGYWGHQAEVRDAEVDFFGFLIGEPAYRSALKHGVAVEALGLRAEESAGRRINLRVQGPLHQLRNGRWRLCPLAFWRVADVWAYLASRKLRYNVAYDRMAELGVPRERWRVSTLMSLDAADNAAMPFLREVCPGLFWQLAAVFPGLREYT